MNFKIYTLVDITPTGARRGAGKPYLQEQNYMTVIQTIGIRTNPLNVIVSKSEGSVTKLPFGSKYKGKQNVWCLEFDIDSQGGHSIDMLKQDFELVPFIADLEESVELDQHMFITENDKLTNIFFEFDDK